MPKLTVQNLRIGPRLVLGFGSVLVLLVVLVAVGWSATSTARSSAHRDSQNVNSYVARVRLEEDALNISQYANMVAADYEGRFPVAGDLATAQAAIRSFLADLATVEREPLNSQQTALLRQAKSAYDYYISVYRKALLEFASGTAAGVTKGADLVAPLDEDDDLQPDREP